ACGRAAHHQSRRRLHILHRSNAARGIPGVASARERRRAIHGRWQAVPARMAARAGQARDRGDGLARAARCGDNYRAMKRVLLLRGVAVPGSAKRLTVASDRRPVSRAEVCASRAGDPATPITRFFTGTATVCYSADSDVQLPPGRWNVFARRSTELISDSVVLATSGESKTYDLVLVRAAIVQHDDAPLFAYGPATGAVIPVSDIVPAVRVVPLIVKAGKFVAIGTPATPKAGTTVRFEFPEEKGSVIVPVTIEGK